jgi:Asp-tRNA(Asn)/Glu-tRNA(Gln) amidotransferase A subunit family amidase
MGHHGPCDRCLTTASHPQQTNPVVVVPGSMLGAPSVSMPMLNDTALPLGLHTGAGIAAERDAALFTAAGWIEDTLHE